MSKAKRSTPLKKKILDLLEKNHLLSASQILEKLHDQGMKVNKTSVYRNLESFLEDHLICTQSFSNEEFVYELQSGHHDHAVCENCGKVAAIPCTGNSALQVADFKPTHHHHTLFGMCGNCQR
jgi:Fur family peroxide stress response transcriptional regulator